MPQSKHSQVRLPASLQDRLYQLSGVLSAICLAIICLMILLQVLGRIIDALAFSLTGHVFGLAIPSLAVLTGFFLVAATFLGLAYTFKAGTHIRVTLLLHRLPYGVRLWVESGCLLMALAMTGYFIYFAAMQAWDSYRFGEVSYGMLPIPLWIPQSVMVLGLVIMAIGIVDNLIRTLRGETGHIHDDRSVE